MQKTVSDKVDFIQLFMDAEQEGDITAEDKATLGMQDNQERMKLNQINVDKKLLPDVRAEFLFEVARRTNAF